MCGALVVPLRMCGHDTAYALDEHLEADDQFVRAATHTGRTAVTRDSELAAQCVESILVESNDPDEQLRELSEAGVSLELDSEPTLCGRCNGAVEQVENAQSAPEYVPDTQSPVWQCSECAQYFWKGSHWKDVRDRITRIRGGCH